MIFAEHKFVTKMLLAKIKYIKVTNRENKLRRINAPTKTLSLLVL